MDSAGRQSPSGWDGTMKSLLNEALARHQEAEAKEEREAAKPKAVDKKTGDDEEIEQIVESINVSIKIVGCGGGGCRTRSRRRWGAVTAARRAAPAPRGADASPLPSPASGFPGERRPPSPSRSHRPPRRCQ